MKMKTRGLFALVEGECDWVVFTGRNYKGSSQHLSQLQKVRLGVVRSARLLCSSSHRSAPRFSTAGSSGISLRTGLAMVGLLLMLALLAVVWRKRGSRGDELQEQEQEDGNLGQELQEMIGDGQSCQSRADNLQGLAGRIEPGGEGIEQGI